MTQLGTNAAKSAPPVAVTLYTLVSNGLPFIISLLTLIYLAFQISYLLWTWHGKWRAVREARKAS